MRAPRQGWPLAVVLVGVFAVGATLGAYGWSARDRIAAASDVNLVAGPIAIQDVEIPSGDRSYRITANVFNLADADVTVDEARVAGWTVTDSQPTTVIPAREWASIPLTVAPDCDDSEPAPELELRLGADRGGEPLTLPLRGSSTDTFGLQELLCSEDAVRILVRLDDSELTFADGALEMRIPVHAAALGDSSVTLAGVEAGTPAFRASAGGLPVELQQGEAHTLAVRWTVEDCAAVEQLADVQLAIRTDGTASMFYPLPGEAVAALARLGVTSCSD